jgi:hypothetical protein
MEIRSGLTMNSLIWLTSPRPDDEGWTARNHRGCRDDLQKAAQALKK